MSSNNFWMRQVLKHARLRQKWMRFARKQKADGNSYGVKLCVRYARESHRFAMKAADILPA